MPSNDDNDIDFHDLEVKVLEDSDDLSAFDCSKNDIMGLNEFIHSEAMQFQKENLGVTYLFLYNGQIVGFTTIAMSQIEMKLTPLILPFPVTMKYYPALKIGRLAVDNNYRDRDIGTNLCLWCLHSAKELSERIGCRFIVVLTKGRQVDFYKKCSFKIIPKYEKKKKVFLYLQMP